MISLLLAGSFAFNGRVDPAISVFRTSGTPNPEFLGRTLISNPSFLCQQPGGGDFHAVNETRGEDATLTRLVWDCSKKILLPRESLPSGGGSPCHVTNTGRWLAVANYGGGTVRFYPVGGGEPHTWRHEGSGPDEKRQSAPHPHGVHPSPDGGFVVVPDLGTDEVVVYSLPCDGAPTRAGSLSCPPGSGPRHAVFHPGLPRLYVLTELTNQVLVWDLEPVSGMARATQEFSSLPPGFSGNSHAAEILVHPSGCWLLASNRGADDIGVWRITPDGRADLVGHTAAGGKTPRSMAISPDGSTLAVGLQDSDSIALFRFAGGRLERTGSVDVDAPAFVGFFDVPSV